MKNNEGYEPEVRIFYKDLFYIPCALGRAFLLSLLSSEGILTVNKKKHAGNYRENTVAYGLLKSLLYKQELIN